MARDARAVELAIERELAITQLTPMLDEWCRISILDSRKRDDHLAAFLVEVREVRVATGEGDTNPHGCTSVNVGEFQRICYALVVILLPVRASFHR